jgi:N-acetylglucosaminyldiphosphoundecaprenol N-acetyl-beta-D-mannosaminyltransferase
MAARLDQVSSIKILGSRVHMVEIPDVVRIMDHWVETEPDRCHHVVNTGMHGIMAAHKDPEFKAILNSADLFAPDGILVVLLAHLRGFSIRKKNTGPDLMWEFGRIANEKGYSYFIYGDTEDTLQLLATRLGQAFPGLRIVGLQSPPFRALTAEEDEHVVSTINQAAPDVLWVGLGGPKQDRWISEHRDRLSVPIVVGAGASLKFLSGKVGRAPPWLRNVGLEWLWRLFREPGRVWRRILIDAPQFVGLAGLEFIGLRKYG